MTNEDAIEILEKIQTESTIINRGLAIDMAIAALKTEPCDTFKLDGMLEDAYEHGYQQARYDYEVQRCEDTVKREAVLNTLDAMDNALDENRTVEAYKELLKECYKELPPVAPKPKTGKWVFLHDKFSEWDGVTWYFKCSECGRKVALLAFEMMARPTDNKDWERLLETYPYCHCGAQMEGESE